MALWPTLRGVNVWPSAVDDLVRGVPGIVEYRVEVRRRGALDDLLLEVETAPGEPFETVERALLAAFRSRLGIRVAVARAEAGSLPRYELKARRFQRIDG